MNNKSNGTAVAEQINAKNHLNSAQQHSTGIPTSDTLTKNLHLPSYNSIFPNNDMEWSAKGLLVSTTCLCQKTSKIINF